MKRTEKRLLQLMDEQEALRREQLQVAEELAFHRHLRDDAVRDAAVSGNYEDRSEARRTEAEVLRFERVLEQLQLRELSLDRKRRKLLEKL